MSANNLPNSRSGFASGLITFILGAAIMLLVLGSTGALAFTPADVVGAAIEVKENTIDRAWQAFWLGIIPQGHEWGVDADLLDGFHAASFALQKDFTSFQAETAKKIADLAQTAHGELVESIGSIDFSPYLRRTEPAIDSARLGGQLPSFFQEAANIITGTLPDSRLSANVALLSLPQTFTALKTFSNGLTVSGGTLSLPTGSVTSSFLADGTITGADLASNITISTTGNLTTTSGGTVTSAGLFTLGNGTLSSAIADSSSAIGFNLQTANTLSASGGKLLSIKNFSTEELALDKDGNLTVNGNLISTGTIQGTQLISTIATGTPPFVVSSTTVVPNLHAAVADAPQPNLVLNSDFSRRNEWMTFMPEVFSDTSGWTLVTGSSIGSVASNILTAGSTGEWRIRAGLPTWRDGRFSAQVKLTADENVLVSVQKHVDANNWVEAYLIGGTTDQLVIRKRIAGVESTVTSASFAPTLNNWYWLELEAQGTTYIAKVYSSGASPVAKSSATLQATISGTVSDSQVVAGYIGLASYLSAASQWGGLSTGDGGVYVEGWGPESWTVSFIGKSGKAIGFDEAADAGPISKQWALVAYIPATGGYIQLAQTTKGIIASQAYTFSYYEKTTGKGGSGALVGGYAQEQATGGGSYVNNFVGDAGETVWTRKSVTFTTASTTREINTDFNIDDPGTATGTVRLMLPQLEQGSVATPWRNAPADDGSITWITQPNRNLTSTSTTDVAIEDRDLAANVFLPWDASVESAFEGSIEHNTANTTWVVTVYVDAAQGGRFGSVGHVSLAGLSQVGNTRRVDRLAAGKHRIDVRWQTSAGTVRTKADDRTAALIITATRGK